MKNKQNWIPIIGIAFLVLTAAYSIANKVIDAASGPETVLNAYATGAPVQSASPISESSQGPIPVSQIENNIIFVLEQAIPDHYNVTVDRDAETATVDIWSDGVNAAELNKALTNLETLRIWQTILDKVAGISASIQNMFDDLGCPEYTAIFRFVSCDDHSQIFALMQRGEISFDVVDSTPAGQTIEQTLNSLDGKSSDGEYIVDTFLNTFHRPDCIMSDMIGQGSRVKFTGDRADLIAQGFSPCYRCMP